MELTYSPRAHSRDFLSSDEIASVYPYGRPTCTKLSTHKNVVVVMGHRLH